MTNDDTQTDLTDGGPLPPPSPLVGSTTVVTPTAPIPDSLHQLFLHDGLAVAVFELDGTIRDLSRPMLDLIGAASVIEVSPDSSADAALRSLLDHLPSEVLGGTIPAWQGRVDIRSTDGRELVFRTTAASSTTNPPSPGDGGGGSLSLILHDTTTPDDQVRRLLHRATHDPLTDLPDRRQIVQFLTEAIDAERVDANASSSGAGAVGGVAVVHVSLDNVRHVNEAFGQAAGDRLVVSSAQRLARSVRPVDGVGRLGGDDFLVVASGTNDTVAALELAERTRRALTGRLHLGDLDIDLSASIGVAVSDDELDGLSPADAASCLVANASSAANRSKRGGRGRSTLFTAEMRSTARDRVALAPALATAIDDGDLTLDYQAIHSAMSGAAVAAEALVRWTHPTMGPVGATTIVDVAEASGTIERLGRHVLGTALADLRRWQEEDVVDSSFAVHVNVSRVQLESSSFVNLVIDQLRHHRVEPSRLVLEARESPLLGRESDLTRTIRALRRAGVRVAIDDFGTGAKALEVLTDVGADVLKLDGSLALPSGVSHADDRLVRSVIALAHALDIDVVAERVTGRTQLERLQAAGCDMLQGNLLGPPMAANSADFSTTTPI